MKAAPTLKERLEALEADPNFSGHWRSGFITGRQLCIAEIRQYLSDPATVEMVARAIYPLAFEIPYVIPENEYQRLKNQTLEIMKKQALRSATDALSAIGEIILTTKGERL